MIASSKILVLSEKVRSTIKDLALNNLEVPNLIGQSLTMTNLRGWSSKTSAETVEAAREITMRQMR